MGEDRPPRSIEGTVPLTPPGAPARAGGPDRLIGQVIDGRYRVRAVVGEGGMGKVYLCDDEKLNRRRVAIKLMSPLLTADPEFRARFKREAVLQANLPHPQIVQVIDVGESSEGAYIAMEYSDGRNLSTLIRELGPRPLDRALDVAEQLLEVLDFAHRQGVVHRDLKPSNILIEDRAGREYVRVLDFGIAKLVAGEGSGDHGLTLTKSGHAYGTLGYMAPEQARGESESIDHRTDLYSVGVILHEMLTGRVPSPPEARTHPVRYAMWVAANPIRPMRETHPDLGIPQEVDNLILGALRRDPIKRHPSALAFLSAIREFRRTSQAPTVRAVVKGGRKSTPHAEGGSHAPAVTRPASIVPWLLAALLAVGGGVGWWFHLKDKPTGGPSADPELGRRLAVAEEAVREKERSAAALVQAKEAAEKQASEAREERDRLSGEVQTLQANLKTATTERDEARTKLTEAQARSGDSPELRQRAEKAESDLTAALERERTLKDSETDLKKRLSKVEEDLRNTGAAGARVVELEGQVSSLSQAVQNSQRLQATAEEDAERLRKEAGEALAAKSAAESELVTARSELSTAQADLRRKDEELSRMRQSGNAAEVSRLSSELTTARAQLSQAEGRASTAESEVYRLRDQVRQLTTPPTGPPHTPVVNSGPSRLTVENGFPDNLEIAYIRVQPGDGTQPYVIEPTMSEKDIPVGKKAAWNLRGSVREMVIQYRKWDRGNRRYHRELHDLVVRPTTTDFTVRIEDLR